MKVATYCILPVALATEPITLPEIANPMTGLLEQGASPVLSPEGVPAVPGSYGTLRMDVAHTKFIIKGEWTLVQQLGLVALGGVILTHTEALAEMATAAWTPIEE